MTEGWVFVNSKQVTPHGPYSSPEGSVAGFNRFAHSAGPGREGQGVEWMWGSEVKRAVEGFKGPHDMYQLRCRGGKREVGRQQRQKKEAG